MPHDCTFKTSQVSVGDSAAVLFDITLEPGREYYGSVKNIGNKDVFVGCSTVTANCGYRLEQDEELELKFYDSTDELSAICVTDNPSSVCWFIAAYG
jgi:cold shock CspA family protein